jgi:prepilin-type N-terminal cleavage/methylation domain-containing protein
MYTRSASRGFTFTELLVVMAIIGIITAISAVSFKSMYQHAARTSGASEMFEALTQARAKTLSAQNDMVYGVHVSSTAIVRFEGGIFTEGGATNQTYAFEGAVRATSSIIASNNGTIVFTKLAGIPSASGEIHIYDAEGVSTTTLILHETGLVEYK